jgi:hypothetical protein
MEFLAEPVQGARVVCPYAELLRGNVERLEELLIPDTAPEVEQARTRRHRQTPQRLAKQPQCEIGWQGQPELAGVPGVWLGVAYPEELGWHVHGVEDTASARLHTVSIQALLEDLGLSGTA